MDEDKKKKKPLKKVLREWAESFSIALLLALGIKMVFFEIYKIPTSSMEPTLIGKLYGGDRIVVNKFKYRFKDPRRWDVFVFHSPSGDGKNLIKRVTGLPGDSISVMHGDIFINNDIVPEEKPANVRESVYIQNEELTFSDDAWKYRFKPVNCTAENVSGPYGDVLSVECPGGTGKLVYIRPITNFYIRKGAGAIVCPHAGGSAEYYKIPEASTLNSLITCPAPGCDRKVDLFTLRNTLYRIQIRQEKSTSPGQYEPVPYDSTPVGDMKIVFDIHCRSCTGHTGCSIIEDNIEYIFILASVSSGRESLLRIQNRYTKETIASDTIPFSMYEGFKGTVGFENCDNRENVYVDGIRVYSRVFNLPPSPPVSRGSGMGLVFRGFSGTLDNFKLFRDIYYTNNENGNMQDGKYAVNPGEPFRLADDQYFAMGDNSANSRDSRYFGPVKRDLIMGNGLMVFPWFKHYIPPKFTDRWKVVH